MRNILILTPALFLVACTVTSTTINGTDSGTPDSGTAVDSGMTTDSGSNPDTGTTQDASTNPDGGTDQDSGNTTDSGSGDDGGTDGGTDAAAPIINGCTLYEDDTAAGATRTITWDFSVNSTPQHCMHIKVGQTVTWNGDFTAHPLQPFNGDTPSPIVNGSGGTAKITFPNAGTYGYDCVVHGTALEGAVMVTP